MSGAPDCSRAAGVLRRTIGLAAHDGEVRAAVEDDYHHFRVLVRHDGRVVTGVESEALRIPWATCALAHENWSKFIGAPLDDRSSAIADYVEMKLFCTHMFELAGLAMAMAARGIPHRRYEMAVGYGGRREEPARLWRDGELVLAWRTDGQVVLDPAPYAGRAVGRGFAAFARQDLDVETCEAALVLRRAIIISGGRTGNLDAVVHNYAGGGCYATQPERAPTAWRIVGSTADYELRAEELLAADTEWLEGASARAAIAD